MRIAILLSGQLRNIDIGYEFIRKNLMDGYNCDVFIHSWYDSNSIGTKFSHWWPSTLQIGSDKKVIDMYRPKKFLIEPQEEIDVKTYNADKYEGAYRVFATLSMFRSIQKCNQIKNEYVIESGTDYDVVVRARFDFGLFTKIEYEKYDYQNKIFFKDDCNHIPNLCMNDHFAFGSSKNMNYYCNTFDEIENIYYNMRYDFNPEIFLGVNLKKIQKIECMNIKIRSGIIRDRDINKNWISNT
jgi:hypothetical protein